MSVCAIFAICSKGACAANKVLQHFFISQLVSSALLMKHFVLSSLPWIFFFFRFSSHRKRDIRKQPKNIRFNTIRVARESTQKCCLGFNAIWEFALMVFIFYPLINCDSLAIVLSLTVIIIASQKSFDDFKFVLEGEGWGDMMSQNTG